MYDKYQVAAGTIPGRRHIGSGNLLNGRNNQDAYGTCVNDSCLVAAVFDGCSSARHAEVGAKIAAELLPKLILNAADEANYRASALLSQEFWNEVKSQFLGRIGFLSRQLCPQFTKRDEVIADYFLFTVVGFVITKDATLFFSAGDGVFALNGNIHTIGPFKDNAPPYLCYELMDAYRGAPVSFVLQETTLSQVDSALIATDGLLHLFGREDCPMPGKPYTVGPISRIWESECFFGSCAIEESLTPWLRKLNSEVVMLTEHGGSSQLRRFYGLLGDDTTIVAIRRRDC